MLPGVDKLVEKVAKLEEALRENTEAINKETEAIKRLTVLLDLQQTRQTSKDIW